MDFLDSFKIPLNDLSKLNEEHYPQFVDTFMEHPGHEIFYNMIKGDIDFDRELYRDIIGSILDICSKKLQ